jgi:hypothetical protein
MRQTTAMNLTDDPGKHSLFGSSDAATGGVQLFVLFGRYRQKTIEG